MTYSPDTIQMVLPILPIPSPHGRELNWLRAMIVDPSIALSYLESAELNVTLRHLYQYFFPFEFYLSTVSSDWEAEQHSEKELEFFNLINDRLFYLPIEGEGELCTGIPVFSIAPEYWYDEYEWGELDHLEKLLLGLSEQVEWSMIEQTFFDISLPAPISPNQIDWQKFMSNCKAMLTPLKYFYIAVEIFDRVTNNPFLDTHDYEFVDFWTWSIEAIEELTNYYRQATQLQQQARDLVDWLTEKPDRLIQLVELWNQSTKSTPTTPNIKIISASELNPQSWSIR